MKTLSTACLLTTLVVTTALAQTEAGGAPPGGPGPESRPPETKAERQRNSAAKIAGLLDFVQNACPDLQPDRERFKGALAKLGVPFEDLSAGDLLLRSRAYTEVYAKDAPANCAKADAYFGPAGTTIPGLVVKRAAP